MNDVFERMTERAKQVVTLGQDEARKFKHNYIGTEHLLLGLFRVDDGLAARVLTESLQIDVKDVRDHVEKIVGTGDLAVTGQIPFTPRSKKILENALREALSLGHNYIGTEHILLGLSREGEGVACRILDDLGCDHHRIREAVLALLVGPQRVSDLAEDVQEKKLKRELAVRIGDLKNQALDAGLGDIAARLRVIEKDLS